MQMASIQTPRSLDRVSCLIDLKVFQSLSVLPSLGYLSRLRVAPRFGLTLTG